MSSALHYADDTVTLMHGDALDCAADMETGSVQTIVTSPPYYGLRDYGEDGQYGAEASVGEYIERMVHLFRELRRVLADDGTLWLNLGDSYTGSWGAQSRKPVAGAGLHSKVVEGGQYARSHGRTGSRREGEPPAKNLLGVPWRVAFALQDDGWYLRSEIIWAKPNPMPSSITDRPTSSHEHIFLMSKSPRYYFDAAAVAEPAVSSHGSGNGFARPERISQGGRGQDTPWDAVGGTRNIRDVWTVATVGFPEAHFAVYPPELIRPCILAGSRPGDVVLDPFSGSGTTGMVATHEARRYIGFDLNAEYLDMSLRTRFAQPTLGIA